MKISRNGQVCARFVPYFCPENHKNMRLKPSTKEDYLQRINILAEYINNHLGDDIDVNHLAEMSGFSPAHFHRIVSAFLGEPLKAYIVRTRIETAARLLRYSDLPVQEIAYKVGYDVPSSLSKAFRQFYGISPNEYRNNKDYCIMKPVELWPDIDVQARVETVTPQQVIYIRLTGDYPSLDFCGTWTKLYRFAGENGLASTMGHICIYYDDPKVTSPEKLRTDLCLTVEGDAKPKGEVGVKSIGGKRYAVFTYKGSYQFLRAVYDTIYAKLLPELGLPLRDEPNFEKYVTNPDVTKPEDSVTEIYVPVE